jgi:ubiquinone/menaquinone biosynthesis C-methylase UbiE
MLHVNYAFVLDCAQHSRPGGKILDFGCGSAETVRAGLPMGLDIYGTDIFDGPNDLRPKLKEVGLLGDRVFEIADHHRIPFPDRYFDFVFHNQVIEHVQNIDDVLTEIGRVLKDDGLMLSLFPSKESIFEGHCGIPYAHRFRHDSRIGFAYVHALRRMGFGTHHQDKATEQWTRDFMDWIHQWCHYRSKSEALEAYERAEFSFERHEIDYVKFRLEYTQRAWLAPLFAISPGLTSFAFSKLGGMVVVSKKDANKKAPSSKVLAASAR